MVRSVLAGIFLWLAFPPVNFWPAAIIGAALLFSSLVDQPLRQRILNVAVAQSLFFFGLLHWTSTYVGSIPWLVLVSTQVTLTLPLAFFSYKRRASSALVFALTWALLEVLREKFPFGGFGWGRIGFSQVDSSLGAFLPLGGVTLVSIIVFTFASLIQLGTRTALRIVSISLLLLIGAQLYEFHIDRQIAQSPSFKVSAVQGGVNLGLDFNRTARQVFLMHSNITGQDVRTLRGSLFVLWPENSVDIDPFVNPDILRELQSRQDSLQSYLIVGAVLNDHGLRNASLMLGDGEITRYYKRDLAPFGEYIPLRKIAEVISPYARDVTDFTPGKRRVLFRPHGIPIAPLICFEVLDDQFVAQASQHASVLAIQTNNATFGRSAEASQQFLINRVRAYELRKPAVIASTTGVTAIINSKGEEMDRVTQFNSGVAVAAIQPNRYQTFRAQYPLLTEILASLFLFFLLIRRMRST